MLETQRLVLTHWEEADALRELREGYLAEEEYKLVRKADGAVIGSIGLRFGEDACSGLPAEPEVGFWLDEPFQGQGYAGEALEALLGRAREALGCPAVWGCYYEGNARSARLLERFGFSLVRVNPCGDTRRGYTMPEAELRLVF